MEFVLIALVSIAGLLMGSFFNVCIYRVPRDQSIVKPASRCTSCGTRLAWRDLMPVISWVSLGGKCRYCKSPISYRYTLVELLTGLIFVVLYLKFGISGSFLTYAILCSILIIATLIDLDFQIIPDGLVLTGAIFALLLIPAGLSVHWKDALLGMLAGGGTFLLIALLSSWILKKEGMGGGDIKLMGMIGLFIGWKLTALSILLSIYAGGIIGGLLMLLRKKKRGDAIPYGPFIAAGTVIAILYGNDLIQWYILTFL
ncbi:MAG TPA: prepilin peptidase [Clostridiales bacterium]|jgi:leader peptidase (prepilin peptidase)/N-methyltransferase|nr:prepilin peptidase [Clostridiales bacterium]